MKTAPSIHDKSSIRSSDGWFTALAEVLLLVLVFFVASGDPPPMVNEPHYLCRLKHYWNPNWCQGDLFLDSTDAHLTVVIAFGWLTKYFSLTTVAWMGRLLSWTLLAIGWRSLASQLKLPAWWSILAAAFFVYGVRKLHFAGEWIVGGFEAKCIAYAFVVLGLNYALKDRWRSAWVHLGLASAFHVLVGGWSVIALAGAWLIECRTRKGFRQMLPGLLLGGLFALAGVLPPLLMNANVPDELANEANQIYVYERLPHHLAPLTKKPAWVLERGGRHLIMLGLLAAVSFGVMRNSQKRSSQEYESADAEVFSKPDGRPARLLCYFAWMAAALAFAGVAIELVLDTRPELGAKLLRYYWFRLSDIAAPLAVSLVGYQLIASHLQQRHYLAVVALAIAIGTPATYLAEETYERWQNPVPPAERRAIDYADWREACDWVIENTKESALFLTPRNSTGFKWRTGRPEVVTHKDVPQDAASMIEWRRRLNSIHQLQSSSGESYTALSLGHLGEPRLMALHAEYQFDYVLTSHQQPLRFPIAFRNSSYVIYQVSQL